MMFLGNTKLSKPEWECQFYVYMVSELGKRSIVRATGYSTINSKKTRFIRF